MCASIWVKARTCTSMGINQKPYQANMVVSAFRFLYAFLHASHGREQSGTHIGILLSGKTWAQSFIQEERAT